MIIGRGCEMMGTQEIAEDVWIGNNVHIDHHVVIYPGVTIEDDCHILPGAVIGRLSHRPNLPHRETDQVYKGVIIGQGSMVGAHVVIYTNVVIGRNVLLGDGTSLREGTFIDNDSFLGRYNTTNYNAKLGKRVRAVDFNHFTGNMTIGDDCFFATHVGFTNDKDVYLRRFGLEVESELRGATVGSYVVFGSGVKINPGATIGDGCLIGMGAVITKDIPPWSIVMGVPAQVVKPIPPAWKEKILRLAESRGQELAE